MNLVADCGALKLTLLDDERHILVFAAGQSLLCDDSGDAFMTYVAGQLAGTLTEVLERGIEGLAEAEETEGDANRIVGL